MGKRHSKEGKSQKHHHHHHSSHVENDQQPSEGHVCTDINRESISSMALINQQLYCGDQAGVISIFDVEQNKKLESWNVHTKAITRIKYDGTGHYFTSSRDKNVGKLSVGSASNEMMSGHRLAVTGLTVKQDGTKVLSGGRDCAVVLWDSEKAREENRLEVARNIVTDMAWIGNERQAIQCSEDKIMKILDTRFLGVSETFPIKQYFQSCCDVDATGLQVVTGSVGGNGNGCKVSIWDIRQPKELMTMSGHEQNLTSVYYHTFSTRQKRIISISSDCSIRIWDPSNGVCSASLYLPGTKGLTCMSVDGNTIFVGTLHGSIYKIHFDETKETLVQDAVF